MRITVKQFNEFWEKEGQYLKVRNSARFHNNLRKEIDKAGNSESLDEYVLSLKSRRETIRKIVVGFYGFIGHPDSVLYEKRFYDYPFERRLEIAKYLHEPRTLSEISEHFDIDDRTRREDLQALEDGITVLGSTIRIQKEKKERKYYYRTTMHPIFLPLNLTEVYALTVYLERALKDDNINSGIIRDISARVKSQLSDYAFNKLFPDEHRSRAENAYVDDERLAHQRKGIVMYLMKSGEPCRFFWREEEYEGTICCLEDKYGIRLTDGSILDADIKEVDFIIDSLQYK